MRLIQPSLGELIQDPATGSGGFLVSADEYIRKNNSREKYKINPPQYQGVEIEKNTRRICLMNTFLHNLNAKIIHGDALAFFMRMELKLMCYFSLKSTAFSDFLSFPLLPLFWIPSRSQMAFNHCVPLGYLWVWQFFRLYFFNDRDSFEGNKSAVL